MRARVSVLPAPWADLQAWKRQLEINLWGVIHCCHAFLPAMLEGGEPGVVINTGSKQGITNPPGNGAYNLSKAGVKSYTESLAHALRQEENCALTAHLLIPGFTYTGMIARFIPEKPAGPGPQSRSQTFSLSASPPGISTCCAPITKRPGSSISNAWPGIWGISRRTEAPSPAGIQLSRRPLRRSWREAKLTLSAAVRKPTPSRAPTKHLL